MFKELYLKWLEDNDIQLSRALDMHVLKMLSPAEQKCQSYIEDYRTKQARTWEQEPFKQRKHLVDAQRKLLTKETKSARSDERIATDKINTLTTKSLPSTRVSFRRNTLCQSSRAMRAVL